MPTIGQNHPDPANAPNQPARADFKRLTVAVVDRLVHHATIFEMNVESYRRRAALERKRGRGRPSTHATIAANV